MLGKYCSVWAWCYESLQKEFLKAKIKSSSLPGNIHSCDCSQWAQLLVTTDGRTITELQKTQEYRAGRGDLCLRDHNRFHRRGTRSAVLKSGFLAEPFLSVHTWASTRQSHGWDGPKYGYVIKSLMILRNLTCNQGWETDCKRSDERIPGCLSKWDHCPPTGHSQRPWPAPIFSLPPRPSEHLSLSRGHLCWICAPIPLRLSAPTATGLA